MSQISQHALLLAANLDTFRQPFGAQIANRGKPLRVGEFSTQQQVFNGLGGLARLACERIEHVYFIVAKDDFFHNNSQFFRTAGWSVGARGDRVPPTWMRDEQDAGDHKGPPSLSSSALAPTATPTGGRRE